MSLVKVTAAIICSDEDEHLQLVHWLHHYNQTLYAIEMGKRPPQVNQMETFSREVSLCRVLIHTLTQLSREPASSSSQHKAAMTEANT